jgi:protein-tyrosine phosphatase
MIDLHCHVLPGIDDGPATIEGSVALANAAAAAGIRTLVATPHVNRRYPNNPETIGPLVDLLNERLVEDGVPVVVRPGAEIGIAHAPQLSAEQLSRLHLGDGPWLLLEPSFTHLATGFERTVVDLQRDGHRVVLAHPERCAAFHRDPSLLESLVNAGALTSITAGALVGRFGEQIRRFALRLARDGLIHNVASDAHDHVRRPPGIARELEQVGLGPLAGWLTEGVPAAILTGAAVPPRPAAELPRLSGGRRRWWTSGARRGR